MSQIHLVLMPNFSNRQPLPYLGIACLTAYLRRNDIKVSCTDFRLFCSDVPTLACTNFNIFKEKAYISEISDLPLILNLVKNYKEGRPLLYRFKDIISKHSQYKLLSCFEVISKVEEVYSIAQRVASEIAKYEIIGFSTFSTNFFYVIMLSLLVHRENPDIKIIYGGPQVSLSLNSAKLALKLRIADLVIQGEGERALLNAIRLYSKGKPPLIEGTVAYNRQGDIFSVKPRGRYLNVDNLPQPDFSIFPLEKYNSFMFPMYASRGCIFKCRFCSYNKMGLYRLRDPVKVVDTMEYLHKKYKIGSFSFVDSALNVNTKWLERFANELLRRGCDFRWNGWFKPRIKEKLLIKLKSSGLVGVNIGVESFSNRILRKMGRGDIKSSNIIKTIELVCSMNIGIGIGIIVGFPTELKIDFYCTWKKLLRLKERYSDCIIDYQLFQLRPLSDCYENYYNYGLTLKGWSNDVGHMLPEISDIVKDIPMYFLSEEPKNSEKIDRFKQLERTLS